MTRSDQATFRAILKTTVAAVLAATWAGQAIAKDGDAEVDGRPADAQELNEVIVVGSRLASRVEGPAPVTILDRDTLDGLGVSNVADALKYLPQQSFFRDGPGSSGVRTVQLRGLSTGTTLVLINGRRVVPGALALSSNLFDLNTIPLSAVERIEVLSNSASAIYGADAVGGVVNVVLKSNIDRPVIDLSYGAAAGGADERRASLSLGGSNGRAEGTLVLDYFKRDALFGEEREIVANADYRRFGGIDARVPGSNPGNVCAVSGNLPGLSAPCAAVPVGSTGIGMTPADFAATAGQRNLASRWADAAFVSPSERYSAMASGRLELTPSTSLFGEFLYSDLTNEFPGPAAQISRGLVPANNPFNPFGVAVLVDYWIKGLGYTVTTSKDKSYRGVVGLSGQLATWDWELTALSVKDKADYSTAGNVEPARVTAALNATAPSQALNVFEDGPGGSPALLASLLQDPSARSYTATSDAQQVGGFLRGPLFNLPAGPLQAVVGAEWRHEEVSQVQPGTGFTILSADANRESTAAYGELKIPIFGDGAELPLVRNVELTVAGRYDDYSDFGSTFNMQYGLEWRPASTLLLRASYADSYRAPGLYELFQPRQTTATTTVSDPRRGNESVVAGLTTGGNPSLDAETSTSSTVGVVWTPSVSGRPRVSVSYWRIEQKDRIVTSFTPATLLANESYLSGRVTRATPTAEDVAAGSPGRLVRLDTSLLNLGNLQTSGLDVEVSARFPTSIGLFAPSLVATYVREYDAADFASTPMKERVGVADTSGTIPEWRLVGSLAWSRDSFTLTATSRYVTGYDDASSNIRNGRKVPSQVLIDLSASINLDQVVGDAWGLSNGTIIRIGATNIFDEKPHYSAISPYGYDFSQADIRQRFLFVGLSKAF